MSKNAAIEVDADSDEGFEVPVAGGRQAAAQVPPAISSATPAPRPAVVAVVETTEALPPIAEDDFKSALARVQRLREDRHFATRAEQFAHAKALGEAEARFNAIQQSLPVVQMTADSIHAAHGNQQALNRRRIWEQMAYTDVNIKALLAERDALAEQVKRITEG